MATAPSDADSPLDALLGDIHAGRIDPVEFARRLLDVQVFVPVRDEKHAIAGFQRSTRADPLVVEDDAGTRVLVVFSTPQRARRFAAAHADFGGGLVTEFVWLLRRLAAGMAVAINPGDELGFDLDPDMLAMLAGLLPEQAQ